MDAIKSGHNILIISDRAMDRDHVAIPALLALSAIHQHLVREGLRTTAGLVVETGSAREVHHFAVLAGYGAEAVHPYLAMETLASLHKELPGELSAEKAIYNYVKAIGKGLSKIMSKMGVSTYMSYCGAQLFEAIGLDKPLVDKYFRGTASQVGGIGVFQVAEEAIRMHRAAFGDDPVLAGMLDAGGEYAWRVRGEEHMWTPDAIAKLQHSARGNKFETYKEYAQIINDQSQRHMTLRGLFEFKVDPSKAIPSTRSSRRPRSSSASPPARCRWARSRTEAHSTLADRDEPHRRQEQHRRRRRGPGALPQRDEGHPDRRRHQGQRRDRREGDRGRLRVEGRRLAAQQDQAGRLGPLRRDHRVPGLGRSDPDQDGPGRQAGRGRPAARRQGQRVHRLAALLACRAWA